MGALLVCSHRGPVIFSRGRGGVRLTPAGPGGLVTGVAPAMERSGGTWLFAPTSVEESHLAEKAPDGITRGRVTYRLLDLPASAHQDHYATISVELLMPLFHYLLPLGNRPAFTDGFACAWDGYRLVNSIYAAAIRRYSGGYQAVLVEDVHLMLVAAGLRNMAAGAEPTAPLSYFHHVPWCAPDYFGVLPASIRTEILTGLLFYDSVGFHCRRWLEAFWECCARFVPDAARIGDCIRWRSREIRLVASPVAIDVGEVARAAGSAPALEWRQRFEGIGAGRDLMVRVERVDPAKNTVRGIDAYAALLRRRPRLAETTCLLAVLTPVRTWMPEYRDYLENCQIAAAAVNERFNPAPVCLLLAGQAHAYDRHRALAALAGARTVMVTSIFDGCNLVAMEAMAAGGQPSLVLSENTGAHEWFGEYTWSVNPFDVEQTADAMEDAMDEEPAERIRRAAAVREAVAAHTPDAWIQDRLSGLGLASG